MKKQTTKIVLTLTALIMAMSTFSSCGTEYGDISSNNAAQRSQATAQPPGGQESEVTAAGTTLLPENRIYNPFELLRKAEYNQIEMEAWVERELSLFDFLPEDLMQSKYNTLSSKQQEIWKKIYIVENEHYYAGRMRAELGGEDLPQRITVAEIKSLIDASELTGDELDKYILRHITEKNKYPDFSFGSGIELYYYILNDDSGDYYIFSGYGFEPKYYYYYFDPILGLYGKGELSEIGSFGEIQ